MTDQPATTAPATGPATEAIEVDEYIEARPEVVFDYVTDPERRPFGRDDTLRLGDELTRETPSRVSWEVTVADGVRRRSGTVEVALSPEGPGTRVRVTHRLAPLEARLRTFALAA
ncbi:MAG: hypothetical protein WD058_00025 [Dehalococcoidia bacterium]